MEMTRSVYVAVSLVLFVFCATSVSGRGFTRCDLAHALLEQGFPMEDLRDWICLIEVESERLTTRKEGPKKDGSFNWGLFQINDMNWCRKSVPGGDCNMKCSDLLKDDITKAATCARTIYHYYGFSLWDKYLEKCQYFLPELHNCGSKFIGI